MVWRSSAAVLLLMIGALPGSSPEALALEPSDEPRLIAAFLYQFLKYTEWPAREPASDVRVLFVESDSVRVEFETIAAKKKVNDRKIGVVALAPPVGSWRGELAFVGGNDPRAVEKNARELGGCGCLIVTYVASGAPAGSAINFFPEEEAIRFEINRAVADAAGLRLSSQLLKLARQRHSP